MTGLYEALIKKFQELLETKTPEKAAAIIKKEYYSTGPDRKNLKNLCGSSERITKFCLKQ